MTRVRDRVEAVVERVRDKKSLESQKYLHSYGMSAILRLTEDFTTSLQWNINCITDGAVQYLIELPVLLEVQISCDRLEQLEGKKFRI